MSVWFILPSVRLPEEADKALQKWRDKGYKLAVLRDPGALPVAAELLMYAPFEGYAASVNTLAKRVLEADPSAQWLIAGNDDVHPDATHAPDQIAAECVEHFGGTFGEMQPNADKFGALASGSSIVHPWMGRDWCRRIYQGRGPLWPGYKFFFEDAENRRVAEKLGRLWLREDLLQFHDHVERLPGTDTMFNNPNLPPHKVAARSHWAASRLLYLKRKQAGFPGHEPLPE